MAPLNLLVLWCVIAAAYSMEQASFFGSSYIHVPIQDARSGTDIQFRFKTKRADTMLMLAAGRTDYCLIRLESGKLKVHINLGAGESEIASTRGLRLDDLLWHQVHIKRNEADFYLTIDNLHVTKEKLPGRFFELNIHYGLFLGGQGDFSELFLGHHDALRGCLAHVIYNGVDILRKARTRNGTVDVHGVTWMCSPEFEAGVDKDMSFVEDGAFMSLANPIARTGARWEFELKTSVEQGLLLYNTGVSSRSDYVGVEVVGKHLRLLVEKGNGPTELVSDADIADGEWHSVMVHFSPNFMEISVDRRSSTLQLPTGGNRFLDLGDVLFLGGMELNKRARALGQGIKSADVSLKGCFRNMNFDGRRVGLQDARTTQGLLPECVWEFPCVQNPCEPSATCRQVGVQWFHCDCQQKQECVRPEFADKHKAVETNGSAMNLEIVRILAVAVEEGSHALITAEHLDVVLDYRKYGVRDSGLLMHLTDPPRHGKVQVDSWDKRASSKQVFTMLDIAKDKVRYLHDGSENYQDVIKLNLELSPDAGFVLPNYLQGRHSFLLHVNVTPVNDAPTISFGLGKVLRLAQGTRKVLVPELVHAEDADNPSEDLVYSVLHQGAKAGEERGFVERVGQPGLRVDTFTQSEINNHAIAYVHRGKDNSNTQRLALQVSDGMETSQPAFLRISTFPLQIRLLNNTGIVLTLHSHVIMTPANLSFATNAEDTTLEVRYDVTAAPQFGDVQRLRPDVSASGGGGVWQPVLSFTSTQIARGEVRYIHSSGTPTQDSFKFNVAVMQVTSTNNYDFRITFTKLLLEAETVADVFLNGSKDATITEKHLKFTSKPINTPSKNISYHIIKAPKYGLLHLNSRKRHLGVGDKFTQDDVESARLRYRLHRKGYSEIRDDLTFQASVPEAHSAINSLAMIHKPTQKTQNEVKVTLERLQVEEGGRRPLLPSHLDLRAGAVTALSYNITHGPYHGRIEVTDERGSPLRHNTSYFSSTELLAERVFYCHDDTETRKDSFNFIALSSKEDDFQFVGVFHVDIALKNDNSPVRTVNKVFNVVSKGQRLLTGKDLMYSDSDQDTKPSDIMYTRRGIPNGGLYSAQEPSKPVFDFTQEDLNMGRILFRHEGDEYGKVGLWISDGKFFDNGVLEVRASSAYVEMVNNTQLVVQRGGSGNITSKHLAADTNTNSDSESLVYELLEGPSHGYLLVMPQSEPLNRFTQLNIDQHRLSYSHDGSEFVKDFFRFRVHVDGAITEAVFEIKIYPSSFWEDLMVVNNRTLIVEESTSVLITNNDLEVMHPNIAASDITYFVVQEPRYGSLEIEHSDVKDDVKIKVEAFEQSIINDHKLSYIQEIANKTEDELVVDVSNGITWLRGLVVRVTVIPEVMYIVGGQMSCMEGQAAALPPGALQVPAGYYSGRIADYRLSKPPQHGILRSTKQPDVPLQMFTAPQLAGGHIEYLHDGSESLSDEMEIVGRAGEKESLPAKIYMKVQAINDQPPVLVNNTGLELWEGSSAIISNVNLAASDEDTPPENVTYIVSSVHTGFIAMVTNPNKAVYKFTQADIDSNQILFLQTGGKIGSFQFELNDGESTSKSSTFLVTARQVEISLMSFQSLRVFPMLGKPITPTQLLAVTSDHTSSRARSITYQVKTPPTMGKLVLHRDGEVVEVDSFTQREINETRVWYQHMHKFNRLAAKDSFVFDVTAELTKPLHNLELEVDISVASGGLDQFVDVLPLRVREGEQQPIIVNTSRLVVFLEKEVGLDRPELQLQLTSPPMHGDVCAEGVCNATLLGAGATYRHDDSDTERDAVHLGVYLSPGDVLLCNLTCPVTIIPVNDQVFKLITQSPYLTVVQGQSHVITSQDLLTEDSDTPPNNITYEVVSGPSYGYINVSYLTLNSTEPTKVRFSQADVNQGRVIYYHSGPREQPTSFYFRVWDGHFNPVYTVFNIHVLPLTLNVTSYAPIFIQQGSSVGLITPDHITITTNGLMENVKYNITRSPQFGVIYLGDSPTNYFTQQDLQSRKVLYMQVDMMSPGDSFQLATWLLDTDEAKPTVDLTMVVKPLIIVGPFKPIIGLKNKLGTFCLDASPLAQITNSNPNYEIIKKTRLGRLKKIVRSSGERKNVKEKEVVKFSHEELKSGVIYYVIRKSINPDEYQEKEDVFVAHVQGAVYQPARLEFKFNVYAEGSNMSSTSILEAMPVPPRLPGPKSPIGHESGVAVASPNIKKDYVVIVGVVSGVFILAIVVIIVIRCRTVKKQKHREKADMAGPLPLPRPPDDLMPSSPHIKRHPSANGMGNGGTLPHCKVIPLGPTDSLPGSELDIHSRYPYGMSDEPSEDWSSYEPSEGAYTHRSANPTPNPNPLLRRNQYWV